MTLPLPRRLAPLLLASLLLSGCSSLGLKLPFGLGASNDKADPANPAPSPAEVSALSRKAMLAGAQSKLALLQADAALAALAPNEIRDAAEAVKTADSSQYDKVSGTHQVYIADRKVDLARARAETRQLAARLEALRAQRAQLAAPPTTP